MNTLLTSLRPSLVKYAKAALSTADGIPPLDDVPSAAIAASILYAAHDGWDRHCRGRRGGTDGAATGVHLFACEGGGGEGATVQDVLSYR